MRCLKLDRYTSLLTGFVAMMIPLACFMMAGSPAWAADQSAAPADNALEKRIESMEAELKQLREEADARKKLAPTQSEKEEAETEALFAAGREYAMLAKKTLGVEYRFDYSYNSYDMINSSISVEEKVDHSLTHTVFAEYGILDNLAANLSLPFVYKYDRTGTRQEDSVTDLGDISLGMTYQPFKSGGKYPTTLLFGSLTLPSGRSPYDINVDTDISTGNGAWAGSIGASFSKSQDPVVVFGSLFSTYYLPIDDLNQNRSSDTLRKVELGPSISASLGFAFAVSYQFSLNFSYAYTYAFENDYTWQNSGTTTNGTATRSTFSLGTGWRVSPKTSVSVKLSIGLTSNDSDFAFSVRVPFNFDLSKSHQ